MDHQKVYLHLDRYKRKVQRRDKNNVSESELRLYSKSRKNLYCRAARYRFHKNKIHDHNSKRQEYYGLGAHL